MKKQKRLDHQGGSGGAVFFTVHKVVTCLHASKIPVIAAA